MGYKSNFPQIMRQAGFKLRQYRDGPLDWRLMGELLAKTLFSKHSENLSLVHKHIRRLWNGSHFTRTKLWACRRCTAAFVGGATGHCAGDTHTGQRHSQVLHNVAICYTIPALLPHFSGRERGGAARGACHGARWNRQAAQIACRVEQRDRAAAQENHPNRNYTRDSVSLSPMSQELHKQRGAQHTHRPEASRVHAHDNSGRRWKRFQGQR